MEKLELTNNGIEQFNNELERVISKAHIEKYSRTWMRLFLEEALLTYKDELGDNSSFSYNIKKRFSVLLVEISVEGKQVSIVDHANQDIKSSMLDSIFLNNNDGQVLSEYKNGKNIISLSMPISHKKN